MLKQTLLILILIFSIISCGKNEIKNNKLLENFNQNWVKLLQTEKKYFSIIELDLEKSKLSFWWVDVNKISDFEKFNKFYTNYFLEKFTKNDDKNIIATINWQFFTNIKKKNTALSFPLKSNWKIFTDHIDNKIPKRTFIIDEDGDAKILEWYRKEYLENENYKELIVAFTPEVRARKEDKIWRTYIWLKSSKKIVFFIAQNKNQKEMNKIISDYWIKEENIIMMDWWPSSQFSFKDKDNFKQYYWWWEVPQVFIIYSNIWNK